MDLGLETLSSITVFSKYAKHIPELQRRENWAEIVERYKEMMIKKYPHLEESIKENLQYLHDKKVLPSMRALQFAGAAAEVNNSRIYNCCYHHIDSIHSFAETMFLLLGGTGVGYSVQKHHVEKLPEIKKPGKARNYLIEDSIMGWADAIKVLLKAYLEGKFMPKFDFRAIRHKGARLVTAGGKAPGPEPLKICLAHVQALLDRKEEGERLTPLECHDILCHIANSVLSGGIRRSAMIALFSDDDDDMICSKYNFDVISWHHKKQEHKILGSEEIEYIEVIHEDISTGKKYYDLNVVVNEPFYGAKTTDVWWVSEEDLVLLKEQNKLPWYYFQEQRGRANNSAVLLRGAVKKEEFLSLWHRIELSNSGEPGIYWTNDLEWGSNPCVEIALRPFQFCVSGDTNLITREGIDKIENLVDKEVEIWNGEKWSKVKPYQTGTNDRLHRVWFSDGSYLDATDNHKFLVKNRFEKKYKEVETIELIKLLETSKYQLQIPRSNIKYEDGVDIEHAYDIGFVLGDGCVKKGYIGAGLYGEDKKLNFTSVKHVSNLINYNGTPFESVKFDLDFNFCKELKYSHGLPKYIFAWNKQSILKFIAGWADADGTNASKGIRIYGEESKIRDAQLLLTKIGVASSVNLMQKKGVKTNLCERKADVWYLQITTTSEIPCQRLTCNNIDLSDKCKNQIIKRIDTLEGFHNSYCLTEKELHQCVFNNVLTKQCNLCEINADNITDQEDLNQRARVAAFFGTLQAGFTDFHYLRPIWQRTTEKDALLGIGMTGIASKAVLTLDLKQAAEEANSVNAEISQKIEINKAARVTCVKPSGTTSCVLGTSSGIHAWHNDYYLRTLRFNKNEDLAAYLMVNHPELCEDDQLRPLDTVCVRIPIKAPEGSILRTETAIDTLERVKKFSMEWIKPGHHNGVNSHNVSATISIDKNRMYDAQEFMKGNTPVEFMDEWEVVGEWMWDNKEYYNGLSVLPYFGSSFIQAPFEDITKEEYERRIETLKSIDLTQVVELDDTVDFGAIASCAGGACSLEM